MTDYRHGVHYLVNYYKLLEVPEDATTKTIGSSYRRMVKGYHMDRFQGLAANPRSEVEQMSRVLTEAYATLSNPAKRAAYDLQLASWEGPISTSGRAVVEMSRPYWSVYGVMDQADQERDWDENGTDRVLKVSGFDPNTHALLEQLYEAADDPAPELVAVYATSLEKLQTVLAVQESSEGDLLGLTAFDDNPQVAGYLEATQAKVLLQRDAVWVQVACTVQAIRSGSLPMLESGSSTAPDEAADESALDRHAAITLERFDSRAEKMLKLASDRLAVMEKRLSLIEPEYLLAQNQHSEKAILHVLVGRGSTWMAFRYSDGGVAVDGNITDEIRGADLESPASLKLLRKLIRQHWSVMQVTVPTGLEIRDVIDEVLSQHFQEFLD